jgi:hypothetical protein
VRDLDGFDFAAQPSIDKKQIRELTAGRFIANAVGEALRRDRTPTVIVVRGRRRYIPWVWHIEPATLPPQREL